MLPGTLQFRHMPEVCVVIPCFNEEHRLRGADFLAFLDTHPSASLCFVDDGELGRHGGRARSPSREAGRTGFSSSVCRRTAGKAEAVRAGVLHLAAIGSWPVLGYWDADLSTPLDEVDRAARRACAAIRAAGSRWDRG